MGNLRKKIYNISDKGGKRLGFDLPYFVENGFWVLLAQFVNLTASLVMSVVFARYLSKEIFGEYQLLLSFLGILAIISYSGLNTSIVRSVAKGFDYSYVKAVNFSFKKSLLAIPIFLALSFWYYYQENQELSIVLIVAGLMFSFIYAHNKWAAYNKGKAKFELVAKQQILQNITLNVLLIFAAVFFSENLFAITGIYLVVNAGFNTFWHFQTKKEITNKKVDDDCIPYGKYLTKMSLFSIFISYFDKIIIGIIDVKILAIYAIALKLFDVIKQIIKSFYSISFPKFAQKKIKIERYKILIIMLIGVLFTVVLYFVSKPVIIYFYTDKYAEVVDIFRKLIFVLPLIFVSPLFANKARAQKDKQRIVLANIFAPVLAVILSIIVFIITENIEYFVLVKVYILQVAYFIVLVPVFKRN
ncbi:MAG: oligosaccharide flippase family protein [Chlorobi bacterium]|nr:oligosaccharide flippase family protein [Chlorobiota bacterium]